MGPIKWLGVLDSYYLLWATAFWDIDLIQDSELGTDFSSYFNALWEQPFRKQGESAYYMALSIISGHGSAMSISPGHSVRWCELAQLHWHQSFCSPKVWHRGVCFPLCLKLRESIWAVYSSLQLYIFSVGFIIWKKAFWEEHFFLKELGGKKPQQNSFKYFIRICSSSSSLGSISEKTQEFCRHYFKHGWSGAAKVTNTKKL